MHTPGYYRFPAVFGDHMVFVSEGDLWSKDSSGSMARRLTHSRGDIKTPVFSPDGKWIACAASDEGPMEVHIMPAQGGHLRRLTYLGSSVTVHQWTHEGIFFSTAAQHPFRVEELFRINPEGGEPEKLNWGPVMFYHEGQKSSHKVIQRHGYREFAYWKRYRGGTAGDLWISNGSNGEFVRLIDLKGNLARPHILGDRVYFLSDHEGIGNVYSCDFKGQDLKQHSKQKEFFARGLACDGQQLIYHAGGDLYLLDPKTNKESLLDLKYVSDQVGRRRKYFDVPRYLQSYNVHPRGHHVAFSSRGKPCLMGNWEGAVTQMGVREGVRYRNPTWLNDGKRIVMVSDDAGVESLELYCAITGQLLDEPKKPLNIGRVRCIMANPKKDIVALTNHRNEYIIVDIKKWSVHVVDRTAHAAPSGFDWSPDGEWLCYSASINRRQKALKLYHLKNKSITQITDPILRDESPSFDPEGKYIYFLSWRHFDPTYDTLHFELGFNHGCKPYALCLQKDQRSPFFKSEESFDEPEDCKKSKDEDKKEKKEKEKPIQIDLEGIRNRIQPFPVSAGEYSQIHGAKGKIFFISHDLEVAGEETDEEEEMPTSHLEYYDLESQKMEALVDGVDAYHLSLDRDTLMYHYQNRLRVVKVTEKCEEDKSYTRKAGWIDVSRAKLQVHPVLEWRQMYVEAWNIQKDHYWTEDMAQIDWSSVLTRYEGLLDRVGTREEFSDVLWEMQGELGTSHAYVYGGDLDQAPRWRVGSLGATFKFDPARKAYRIESIVEGDRWDPDSTSPFNTPGVDIKVGDYLIAINRHPLSSTTPPGELLINQGGCEVEVEIERGHSKGKTAKRESFVLKALISSKKGQYRSWVESNRAYVSKQTKGKVGYIHIPDMSTDGYAEFHRNFLQESDKEGLIVDVRFNGGGNVSALLLEKLARKRLGYDVSRWTGYIPYPDDSPVGPMVAITNEYAGSDGDIFSHSFKMMKLGPLIGKRTWGGVIGIFPRFGLVDGGMTTQPEYSFWFKDAGWRIENYGVDPDIVVENLPIDYINGRDTQLDKSLGELKKIMDAHVESMPDMASKPKL